MTKGPRYFCFSKIVLTNAIQAYFPSCPEVLPTSPPQWNILPDLQVLWLDRFIIIRLDVLVPILLSKLPFILKEWDLSHATEVFCLFYIYLSRWHFHSSWDLYLRLLLPVSEWCFHTFISFSSWGIWLLFISNFYWVHFQCFVVYLNTKAIFILS